MSGEGADEALGGYLYFHKAPNGTELHEECVRKLDALHTYDCLRANKATMAHGLEARVPFLDKVHACTRALASPCISGETSRRDDQFACMHLPVSPVYLLAHLRTCWTR